MGRTAFFRKYCVMIAFSIVIIITIIGLVVFYQSNTNATFFLADRLGQKEALDGIAVTGALSDPYHTLNFTVENGRIKTEHEFFDSRSQVPVAMSYGDAVYDTKVWASLERRIPQEAQTTSEYVDRAAPELSTEEYKVVERTVTTYSDKVAFYCSVNSRDENSFPQTVRFKTDFYLQSNEKEFVFEERYFHGNPYFTSNSGSQSNSEYVDQIYAKKVTLDDKHYVSFMTNGRCKGQSGIYRVDQFEDLLLHENKEKMGEVTKLISIDLEDGRVRVLGLETAQNKLVLILLVDNNLVIQAYDITGKLLGEIEPDIPSFPADSIAYHAFINGDSVSLGIFDDKNVRDHTALVSFTVTPELMITHQVKDFKIEDGRLMILYAIKAVDERLVVIAEAYGPNDEGIYPQGLYAQSSRIFMSIFNANDKVGELAYQGEFITDIADDNLIYTSSIPTSNMYSDYNIRRFFITGIEKARADR